MKEKKNFKDKININEDIIKLIFSKTINNINYKRTWLRVDLDEYTKTHDLRKLVEILKVMSGITNDVLTCRFWFNGFEKKTST